MDTFPNLTGTPQAGAGYLSAVLLSVKVAGWLNAEGFVEIFFHLLVGAFVLIFLISMIHRLVSALRATLGLSAVALLAALSVYLSITVVFALRSGSYHLVNGVFSIWTAGISVAVFVWVLGIEKAVRHPPEEDPEHPTSSTGYANVTALRFIALAMLALPVMYTLIAHNVISAKGVIGIPMPDRGALDHKDPDTYLFRTWTMRVLAGRHLQVDELQRLGMSREGAEFLNDPTKSARTELTNAGVPAFLAGGIVQVGTLLSGRSTMTGLSGFTLVGLNNSNYTFLQGFILGSVPGMASLFALLGFWLLVSTSSSGSAERTASEKAEPIATLTQESPALGAPATAELTSTESNTTDSPART